MKKLLMAICILQLILFVGCKAKELTPQQQAKANEYTEMIESPHFSFVANNAQPMSGKAINLTSYYSLKVTKDSIDAYLPYFGRVYTAPTNPSEGGVKFVSADFDYESVQKKNGSYDIKITPKDITKTELRGITLHVNVSNSGYGSLRLQFINKQGISYYGTLEEPK